MYIARPVWRRPARPHICRNEATVPGKVTQIAASSSPTSMPSSRAFVAHTAISSPEASRCSISRRCAGVYPARYGAISPPRSARPASSSFSRVNFWSSSTPRRDFRKQIVRTPSSTNLARTFEASVSDDTRAPVCSSSNGGFHIATWRSERGAPSRSTSRNSTPASSSASSSGFAIVALVRMKRGSVPYARASRRRRRSTFATCEPNTPRYTCASSTTIQARFASTSPHWRWWGITPMFSMSGFVRMRFELRRIAGRSSFRVSPSSIAWRADRVAREARAQLVDLASLVLGERLRRIEVKRARLAVAGERVEYRQVERERLAGGRSGRDDRVALSRRRECLRLVRVELRDARSLERLSQLWMEAGRERLDLRRLRAVARLAHELLVAALLEEGVPGGSRADDGHAHRW